MEFPILKFDIEAKNKTMQQTALNLIAIGVFAFTLSALLGPLLNISPLIPAATTFGILGLATLDTLSWNGKGTTLLLDSLSSKDHRQRIVYHEAGHFLIAYLFEIPIANYSLSAWEAFKQGQSGLGGVVLDTSVLETKTANAKDIPLMLERISTVWMAGIAAEMSIYGDVRGGNDDRDRLREALTVFGSPQTNYQTQERWALLQAKSLLEKHQSSYKVLVEAMEKRAPIEECYRVIQQTCQ